jgi:hypothetical protein
MGRCEIEILKKLEGAFSLMRDASFQSHGGHWDSEGTGGKNCPECLRARELRNEATEAFYKEFDLFEKILSDTRPAPTG